MCPSLRVSATPSHARRPGTERADAVDPTRRERCLHPSFLGETTPVAVKIKLKRMGKIHAPFYRIIVADARTKRDGRAIEEIGKYHPKNEPSFIEVDSERAQHWLSVGAQPTDPVRKILEITGDWQKFKGLPGAEGTLRTAAPKAGQEGRLRGRGRRGARPRRRRQGQGPQARPARAPTTRRTAEASPRSPRAGQERGAGRGKTTAKATRPRRTRPRPSAKAETPRPAKADTAADEPRPSSCGRPSRPRPTGHGRAGQGRDGRGLPRRLTRRGTRPRQPRPRQPHPRQPRLRTRGPRRRRTARPRPRQAAEQGNGA